MKTLLILGTILLSTVVMGNEKGNGGSGREALLVAQQAQIESVALKIKSFFVKNKTELKPIFPEFNIQVLITKIKESDIQIVDKDELIDRHGKSRTCLNFSNSSLIECKSSGISPLFDQPAALFVLVLHEYLGLIGVEETAPTDPSIVDGYKISKRIASYIAKSSEYDLQMESVQQETGFIEIGFEKKSTFDGITYFINPFIKFQGTKYQADYNASNAEYLCKHFGLSFLGMESRDNSSSLTVAGFNNKRFWKAGGYFYSLGMLTCGPNKR